MRWFNTTKFKAGVVKGSARGAKENPQVRIKASTYMKSLVRKQVYVRTGKLSPDDGGSATMPGTVALVSFGTNRLARDRYWSLNNSSESISPFEGENFTEPLSYLKKQQFPIVSNKLGNVVEVNPGANIHVPTITGIGAIALQQALINLPFHILAAQHPGDRLISAAAALCRGVGAKWGVIPGSLNKYFCLGGLSALSGVPGGASHLTRDLKEVIRDLVQNKIKDGMTPEAAVLEVLTAAGLNFAAVAPAAKQTLVTAKYFPNGPFDIVGNLLLSQVFNEDGLETILMVRNDAMFEGIGEAFRGLGLPVLSQGALEKIDTKAQQQAAPYLEGVKKETEVNAKPVAEAIKAKAESLTDCPES